MTFLKHLIVESVNLIFTLIVAVLMFIALRHYVFQPFQVSGLSMLNTLHNGDQMIMLKQQAIHRFDIVVFPEPIHGKESYVKRIIGMPGDSLYYQDDQLYINHQKVDEPFINPSQIDAATFPFTQDFTLMDTIGMDKVPEGYVFVLGDNRPHSGDSRQFGLVPMDSIEGKAVFIYYPFDRLGSVQ